MFRSIFIAGLCLTVGGAWAEGTLRVDLKSGASVKYKVKMEQTSETSNPQGRTYDRGSTLAMNLVLTLGAVDEKNNKAEFEAKMSDIDMESPNGPVASTNGGRRNRNNNAAPTVYPPTMTQRGTISSLHEVRTDRGQVEMSGMMRVMDVNPDSVLPYLNLHFPDKDVKIGDTWDMPTAPGIEVGAQDSKLTARLAGEKKYRGSDVWEIQIKGSVPLKQDVGALMQQRIAEQAAQAAANGQDPNAGGRRGRNGRNGNNQQTPTGTMSGSTSLQVKALVDKKTGLVLYLDGTAKSVTTTTMNMRGRDVQTSATRASHLTMQSL